MAFLSLASTLERMVPGSLTEQDLKQLQEIRDGIVFRATQTRNEELRKADTTTSEADIGTETESRQYNGK